MHNEEETERQKGGWTEEAKRRWNSLVTWQGGVKRVAPEMNFVNCAALRLKSVADDVDKLDKENDGTS